MVRPSPASVLLRPTARNFLAKSICSQVKFLISASRIPALSANLQLEHLSLAEPDTEQVARIAQDAQQKADFFVDALRRGALTEARILVLNDDSLVEIDQHLAAK